MTMDSTVVLAAMRRQIFVEWSAHLIASIRCNDTSTPINLFLGSNLDDTPLDPVRTLGPLHIEPVNTDSNGVHPWQFKASLPLQINNRPCLFVDADTLWYNYPIGGIFKELSGTEISWQNRQIWWMSQDNPIKTSPLEYQWVRGNPVDYLALAGRSEGWIPELYGGLVYWEPSETAEAISEAALRVYANDTAPESARHHDQTISDEYAWTIGMLEHGHLPHKSPWRPVAWPWFTSPGWRKTSGDWWACTWPGSYHNNLSRSHYTQMMGNISRRLGIAFPTELPNK